MGNTAPEPVAPSTDAPKQPVTKIIEPVLTSESKLLTEEDVKFLHANLPTKYQQHEHWILLYSSQRDGLSMRTFFNAVMMRYRNSF
jgi:hypothetical protein